MKLSSFQADGGNVVVSIWGLLRIRLSISILKFARLKYQVAYSQVFEVLEFQDAIILLKRSR
jgi:hypothetical protein